MRPFARFLLLGLCLHLFTGCNAVNRTQVRITPSAQPENSLRARISPADQAMVKSVLKTVAGQLKLQDMTDQSVIPNLIVFYQEPAAEYPLKLFAWPQGDAIVVDLMQGPGSTGETLAYRRAKEKLTTELQMIFGERARILPFTEVLKPAGDQR